MTGTAWLKALPKCPRCGKCAHPTPESANAHKVILERGRGAHRLHVYRCSGSDVWHVGHDRKSLERDLAKARQAAAKAVKTSSRRRRR